jgi:RNA polymerase sigma-70 factor (sigma-E family)
MVPVTTGEALVSDASAPWAAREPAAAAAEVISGLHAQHYRTLVRLAMALVDQEASAEEVVQEAFERVLRRWDQLRDTSAAEAYLRQAVVNGCRDRLRRRAVRRAAPVTHARSVASAEDTAILNDEQRRTLVALRLLPRRQREVLLLRYFAQLSEAQIADALGISGGTVRSTAHRGVAALRAALTEADA